MQERGLGNTRLLAHMQAPIGVWRSIMQNEQWPLKVLILTNSKKKSPVKKNSTHALDNSPQLATCTIHLKFSSGMVFQTLLGQTIVGRVSSGGEAFLSTLSSLRSWNLLARY